MPDFSKILKLDPGQTVDVPLPVKEALNFGLTFVAANMVSATLIDDGGSVVGTNLKGTPAAGQIFRSLFVDRPVARGNWTLKLQNEDRSEREVVLSTWSKAR